MLRPRASQWRGGLGHRQSSGAFQRALHARGPLDPHTVLKVHPGATKDEIAADAAIVENGAGKESDIPNFKGSYLGHFPLVLADFWTSDHLSERSRSVDVFFVTRARGTLTLKRR